MADSLRELKPEHPLKKTQQNEKTVCALVNCRLCELAIASYLLVVPICKYSINPFTNPDPSTVNHTRDIIFVFHF
jgi:hypothetical protein